VYDTHATASSRPRSTRSSSSCVIGGARSGRFCDSGPTPGWRCARANSPGYPSRRRSAPSGRPGWGVVPDHETAVTETEQRRSRKE
jgi:hypothetical protein